MRLGERREEREREERGVLCKLRGVGSTGLGRGARGPSRSQEACICLCELRGLKFLRRRREVRAHEMMMVSRAWSGGRTLATIPPAAAATIGATTGRSQTPVTSESWFLCRVNLDEGQLYQLSFLKRMGCRKTHIMNGSPMLMTSERTESIHQQAQASWTHL